MCCFPQVTWYLDGLPASVRMVEEDNQERSHLERGFPLGVAAPAADGSGVKESYLFNHIIFKIEYNREDGAVASAVEEPSEEAVKYRIVGFEVEPHTIKHKTKVGTRRWTRDCAVYGRYCSYRAARSSSGIISRLVAAAAAAARLSTPLFVCLAGRATAGWERWCSDGIYSGQGEAM